MGMEQEVSTILMSEALRGQVSEEIENEASAIEQNIVTTIVQVQIAAKKTAIVGILRSVLVENEPELEFKVQLDEALALVEAYRPLTEKIVVFGFELHHGERVIQVEGPFAIKGARVDEISPNDGMCILSLGLRRPAVVK